jgi:hypothetical protein
MSPPLFLFLLKRDFNMLITAHRFATAYNFKPLTTATPTFANSGDDALPYQVDPATPISHQSDSLGTPALDLFQYLVDSAKIAFKTQDHTPKQPVAFVLARLSHRYKKAFVAIRALDDANAEKKLREITRKQPFATNWQDEQIAFCIQHVDKLINAAKKAIQEIRVWEPHELFALTFIYSDGSTKSFPTTEVRKVKHPENLLCV